ncbi:TetR/AcrR family transcriptional regulator [Rothia halotolerans]|uniref:TetR/AcrR family transcriptional regulator n=1 Tax=Rothia halotolerans TaxID=405770 RepID=UPI00101D0937|nr:TetR/AcrR family transcriptional regulator [Rothia halotolerans]
MSTADSPRAHHHGNLRAALIDAGIGMLEAGAPFSLRAVAREVGVSQTAPYRHFPDKQRLEAAMATRGFRDLQSRLEVVIGRQGGSRTPLADLALAYVRYAVGSPALYRLMFGQPCGDDDERLSASAEVFGLIEQVVASGYPGADPHGLATAGWALAHGLASLHLDGKLLGTGDAGLDARVRGAFAALLAAGQSASSSS